MKKEFSRISIITSLLWAAAIFAGGKSSHPFSYEDAVSDAGFFIFG